MPNDFTVDKPAECPFAAAGMPRTDFAAVAHLSVFDFQGNYSQQQWVTWRGYGVSAFVQPSWSTGNQADYFVNYSGFYYAGSSGCNPDTPNKGYDLMYNDFKGSDGGIITATVELDYTCDWPALSLTTPYSGDIPPNSDYPVSVSINDIGMTGPITYQWYVDGELAATTSSPQATLTSGDAFTQQTIRAVASDGYGRSEVGERYIQTNSGCPNHQITC